MGAIKENTEKRYSFADDQNVALVWVTRTGQQSMKKTEYPVVEDLENLTAIQYGFGDKAPHYYAFATISSDHKIVEIEHGFPTGPAMTKTRKNPKGLLAGLKLPAGETKSALIKAMRFGFHDQLEELATENKEADWAVKLLERLSAQKAERIARIKKLIEEQNIAEAWEEIRAFLDAYPKDREVTKLLQSLKKMKSARKAPKEARQETQAAVFWEGVLDKLKSKSPATAKKAYRHIEALATQLGDTYYGKLAALLLEQKQRVEAQRAEKKKK